MQEAAQSWVSEYSMIPVDSEESDKFEGTEFTDTFEFSAYVNF